MIVWTPIALVYLGCLVFGFTLALVTAILGELIGHGDVGGAGHDVDMGHEVDLGHDVDIGHDVDLGHEVDLGHAGDIGDHGDIVTAHTHAGDATGASVFNTLTMMTFIASFGLSGLFAIWVLRMEPVLSLAFATPMGVLLAAVQFLLYVNLFIKAQASSEATMSDILGCEAEVITTIPNGHVGEIAYNIKGTRYNAPATSSDGEEIVKGTRVCIVNIKANTFVVRPV
ncbi:NfeD family protein [bacterium]|nr:NfeD family protein [bacterium]